MITKLTHASIYVLDQESARDFYVNKLGFTEKMNIPLGDGAFWITVSPKEQPDLEITLMPIQQGNMHSEEASTQIAQLVQKGTFGFGVFECGDIYATYHELSEKGVEFTQPPTEKFYGIEAMFKDNSGKLVFLSPKQKRRINMKKYGNLVLLGMLILLSIATGITKLIQLPDEMELFRNAGFSDTLTILFGVVQVIGGGLLIPTKTRKYGALVMAVTFVVATIVVFLKGMIGFGLFSISFIALAGYIWWKNR